MESLPDRNTLLEQSPEQLQAWVERVWRQRPPKSHHNWWLGIAQTAQTRTFADEDHPDITWASIAITLYENLGETDSCFSCMYSAMNMRGRLIKLFGHKPNDSLLDAQYIVRWFYDKLEMSREEAVNKLKTGIAHIWANNPEDLLFLRHIRGRLVIIRRLVKANIIHPDADLQQWLDIQTQLP